MSRYVADRDEFEALQALTDAGDGVQAVLNKYLAGEEITASEDYGEYLTAVNSNRLQSRTDCVSCTETATASESWIWGALEAVGIGVVLGLAAILAEEIDFGEIVGMLL
jgi:hypothetical protein